MRSEFYSLETLIVMHLEERIARTCPPPCFRPLTDRAFLDALAEENNQ